MAAPPHILAQGARGGAAMSGPVIRLATRGSELALAQTREVARRLLESCPQAEGRE